MQNPTLREELSEHELSGTRLRSHHVVAAGDTSEDGGVLSEVPWGNLVLLTQCIRFYPVLNLTIKKAAMVKSAGDAVTGGDVNNEQAMLLL